MARGKATTKLIDASEAFADDLNNARYTMSRIAQIQMKMSECMDECLSEFKSLMGAQRTSEIQDDDTVQFSHGAMTGAEYNGLEAGHMRHPDDRPKSWIDDVTVALPKFMREPQ